MKLPAAFHANRLAARWLLLALAALGLSTLCAVLLVIARAPVLGNASASGELFRSALVLHVGLAVVVWFLSCAASLWTMLANHDNVAGRMAFVVAAAGVAVMAISPMIGTATPVLANYLPVLDSPVFLTGLACFFVGVAWSAALSFRVLFAGALKGIALHLGALLSIVALAIALGVLVSTLAVYGLPHDALNAAAGFEIAGWGAGHALQFVHVLLLMAAWSVLADALSGAAPSRRALCGLLIVAVWPLLAAPAIQAVYPVDGWEYRQAFTRMMAWGLWPAPVALALHILWRVRRVGRTAWKDPQACALLLSIALFLLGCVFGASIRAESTMVPAHYHGTVGAVTLAYMTLGYRLLPVFGIAGVQGRLVRWQPAMYGTGLAILAIGLAWSGWIGIPRKTPHAEIVAHYPMYCAAMGMAVLGGTLAVTGAILFVANMLRSLRLHGRALRWLAGAVSGGVVAAGLFACQPEPSTPEAKKVSPEAVSHAAAKRREEIDARFNEGAAQLAARQYEAAANAMHRVLELAPDMPEAHVNMGYAMIGMQRYAVARDFFDTAINLRPNQANAYYGLALALEGLNDYGGALGAMRSYVHLNKNQDDPFIRKANSAIWEWEEALKKARSELSIHGKTIPENGNTKTPAPAFGKVPG